MTDVRCFRWVSREIQFREWTTVLRWGDVGWALFFWRVVDWWKVGASRWSLYLEDQDFHTIWWYTWTNPWEFIVRLQVCAGRVSCSSPRFAAGPHLARLWSSPRSWPSIHQRYQWSRCIIRWSRRWRLWLRGRRGCSSFSRYRLTGPRTCWGIYGKYRGWQWLPPGQRRVF